MSTEEIVVDTGEAKPAKKAAVKIAPKAAKPAKAKAEKPAKAAKPKKAKAAKAEGESTRKRYEIKLTGELYNVKIDKAFEKKIANVGKHREAESVSDVLNYLLNVAFGRLSALKKWQDNQAE